ncbi:hypothetical protein GF337_05930 [candidate division KSB1 bacterium]|nr:hypothetical protein [candidate division KSB1 bacterium]
MDIFTLQFETIKEMLDWRVSLDIVLIAMVFFFLYQTLRTIGSWKILSGVVLAGIIFVSARFLDLRGIEWIYSNLSQVLVLALIIIFQPELRRFFERAASLRRRGNGFEVEKIASLFSDTAFALAAQYQGAILVLAGNDSVKLKTSEGISLKAEPNFPLLMSIFDPHSPGHDGAVVVEKGMITSFAVRLPLSSSQRLSHEYGTRHHAGMGLSEMTDALVIVISEERGTVTVFKNGEMSIIDNKGELTSQITAHWQTSAFPQFVQIANQKQKRLVTQLAVSFVLAFFFWSTVVLTQSKLQEAFFTVPVEYHSTPKNVALATDVPQEIRLTLIGPMTDLEKLNYSQLRVRVDLSNAVQGKKVILVDESNIRLPRHVRVKDTDPAALELNFVSRIEIEAIVDPQLIGKVPRGYEIASVEVIPKKVNVLVPMDIDVQGNLRLLTTPIYLENVRSEKTIYCNLIAPGFVQPAGNAFPPVEVVLKVRRRS